MSTNWELNACLDMGDEHTMVVKSIASFIDSFDHIYTIRLRESSEYGDKVVYDPGSSTITFTMSSIDQLPEVVDMLGTLRFALLEDYTEKWHEDKKILHQRAGFVKTHDEIFAEVCGCIRNKRFLSDGQTECNGICVYRKGVNLALCPNFNFDEMPESEMSALSNYNFKLLEGSVSGDIPEVFSRVNVDVLDIVVTFKNEDPKPDWYKALTNVKYATIVFENCNLSDPPDDLELDCLLMYRIYVADSLTYWPVLDRICKANNDKIRFNKMKVAPL